MSSRIASMRDMRLRMGLMASAPAFSPAFSPTSLSNLAAWYRADLANVATVSGRVSVWSDTSGVGDANRNALQGTALSRPLHNAANASFNNQPTVDPAGAEFLETGTWSAPLLQTCTYYIVCSGSASGNKHIISGLSGGARQVTYLTGGAIHLYAGGDVATDVDVVAPSIIRSMFAGGSSAVYVNSVATANGTGDAGGFQANGLTIGSSIGGAVGWDGPIAEIVVFSAGMSVGDNAAMMTYLAARYGITVTP